MSDEVSVEKTKSDKFKRLSAARLERALKGIQLIENLSSHSYENTTDEAEEIIKNLLSAVGEVASSFDVDYLLDNPVSTDITYQTEDGAAVGGDAEESVAPVPVVPEIKIENFPSKSEGDELMRIGPMLGSALEDLLEENIDAAIQKIKTMMAA